MPKVVMVGVRADDYVRWMDTLKKLKGVDPASDPVLDEMLQFLYGKWGQSMAREGRRQEKVKQ